MDQNMPTFASADLAGILARQRAAFMAGPFPTAEQRREKLKKLEAMVKRNQAAIADAISADFGNRSRPETVLSEILGTLGAAAHSRKHLGGWMRSQRRAVAMNFKPASNRLEFTPVGVVGVVSPWNYPIFLTLGPLVDILAAGNRCMIKPSELTPATAALLANDDRGRVSARGGGRGAGRCQCRPGVFRVAVRPSGVHRFDRGGPARDAGGGR